MFRFIVRRLIWAVPTLLIVTFLVYVAIRLGTDPVNSYKRANVRASPAKIQEYIDHRLLRERQILEVLGNGAATIPDMVAIIYAEVPTMLHKMAGQSVHSHLRKLKAEGRVSEDKQASAPSRWSLA